MLTLRDVLTRWEADELSLGAAEMLRMSERTLRRWTRRYEEDGDVGVWTGDWVGGPAG